MGMAIIRMLTPGERLWLLALFLLGVSLGVSLATTVGMYSGVLFFGALLTASTMVVVSVFVMEREHRRGDLGR
jgi:hypothetical protein